MKLQRKPLPVLMLIVSLLLMGAIFYHLLFWDGLPSMFIIISSACSLVLTLALTFSSSSYVYNPLVYILLTVFIGVTIRSYYMVYASSNSYVQGVFLGIHDISYFIFPSFLILCALICFFVGYRYTNQPFRFKQFKLFSQKHDWNQKRLYGLVIISLIVSSVGFFLFIRTMGITSILLNISGKRFLDVGGGDYETSLGYYRLMISFINPVFYIFLLNFIIQNKKILSIQGIILGILGVLNLLMPVFTSSRTSIVFFVLDIIIILSIFKRLNMRILITGGISVLLLFSIVTNLRHAESNEVSLNEITLLDPIILNRNLLDVSVASNIINNVPEKKSYQFGKTYLTLFATPIPRQVWPDKPAVMPGKTISHEIYDYNDKINIGIPPGLIGELYFNFGVLGILLGLFMVGIMIKKIYLFFNFEHSLNRNKILFYLIVLSSMTVTLFGGSLNQAVISFFKSFVLFYLALKFISIKK